MAKSEDSVPKEESSPMADSSGVEVVQEEVQPVETVLTPKPERTLPNVLETVVEKCDEGEEGKATTND